MSGSDESAIEEALDRLREVITSRVRAEQLRDQLTGLPNKAAFSAAIRSHGGKRFWVAFIEIDRFKTVNTLFGYESGNLLLQRVAEMLRVGTGMFHGQTAAFRVHGDEFFLVGVIGNDEDPDEVHRSLDTVRSTIARIRCQVIGGDRTMTCTVSIGWMLASDAPRAPTEETLMECLEAAVAQAKRKRDDVQRFRPGFDGTDQFTLRGDCSACGAKFAVDVGRDANKAAEQFWCPNCGVRSAREPAPATRAPLPKV